MLLNVDGARIGVDVKRTDRPRLTPSMQRALADLGLDRIVVVHAGDRSFPPSADVDAVPAGMVLTNGLRQD